MKKRYKYLSIAVLAISAISVLALNNSRSVSDWALPLPTAQPEMQKVEPKKDTTTRFPVKKTQIEGYDDLKKTHPIDLRDPSNIQNVVDYDYINKVYLFKTKVGDGDWVTTLTMTPTEYNNYLIDRSMASFFRSKYNAERDTIEKKEDFSLKDIKIGLGPAERIFGPGGVRIKTQGYIEAKMGFNNQSTDNPTLSPKNRSRTSFDFNQDINMNVKASVGDKVNFDMNYNTEATFDFDSKKIKLAYEGKEDEILKRLEAGNVSMATTNSLVNGGSALFGIRADLQFGKLKISSVLSQQESQSKTVNSKGGVQTTSYEFMADQYDENRHFFLGFYFRDHYDEALSTLPYISSPVTINNIEVWVTNKRGDYTQSRNIVAFADLGEAKVIHDNQWVASGNEYPANAANTLYSTMVNSHSNIRDISQVSSELGTLNMESGIAYEKIENARLLSSSDYTYNSQTGYISLKTALQADEVLAVAYEYKAGGTTYKVGEFAADITDKYDPSTSNAGGALLLKLLKPVSMSPSSYTWHLMMKNVYSLGAYSLQSDNFRLNISYQNDSAGTYVNYISEGNIKGRMLLRVMNLDRLNSRQNTNPDGIFDYVEGQTVNSSTGRIIFPVVEPFGKHLADSIGDPVIAQKYVYQELYDSTLTVARQVAEKNKFKISGVYKASNGSEIDLGATNVARGSVIVKAAGVVLVEGSDYTVNYNSGTVTIINDSYSASDISVSLENQSLFSMQRKTMMGLNLSYDITKDFTIGGTIMHMYEKPLTMKTEIGNEALKNTLWGLNMSYRTQSQWLTNLVDKLPFYNATAPSSIAFTGEFAQMIPGHYENKYGGGYSYLDDFESSKSSISLMSAYSWVLASAPADKSGAAMFPEATLSNNIEYGKNRAHIAWFSIDNLFTRKSSSLTPQHIKDDKDQLSNHFVREVLVSEIYPNRDISYSYNENATITPLNISYYPDERGAYNIYPGGVDRNTGKLLNPKDRWGGIMRKMDNKDFEANNIETIEFWLMDPFVYNDTATIKNTGGDLFFNLGEISEDVLKDGKKFYENGLPLDGDTTLYETNNWGRVPSRQSTVYAFDSGADRSLQDVGYNGLSTAQEMEHHSYKTYRDYLLSYLDPTVIAEMQNDKFSPLNDPAGDNYHYFRGSDYDRDKVGILDRYKRYNGTEGNSVETEKSGESYGTASRTTPDVEDIDQDNTMNETESYYQYKISLRPDSMQVGMNYIADEREVTVTLRNGKEGKVKWYQFKVPISDYEERVGSISNFKSIRYMRMFMTHFEQPTFLRFGTLDLVRGDWRTYTSALTDGGFVGNSTISTTTVNIEENGSKKPINYIMPPGVTRIIDPSQPQLTQENEQSLSMTILNLGAEEARAIYKNTVLDLRRYKRLQMFSHAEKLIDGTDLKKDELAIFLRLGSDYKNNYYEYEIPLTITPEPAGKDKYDGNNANDRLLVWPEANMFDFPLELLKNIKLERNKAKRKAGSTVTNTTLYSEYDPDKPTNKVSVVGNPSLSEVKVMMVGVRNKTRETKSGEIWINEMRLTDFDEEGGWAAQGSLNIALSDLATINLSGHKETIGFGSLDQSLMERRDNDLTTYNLAANIDLGKLLPEKAKVTIPLYYSYSNQTTTPKYDPFDQDVTLKESLSVANTKAEKDSIRNLAQDRSLTKNLSISNAKVNVRSKTPMPYDPANVNFTYSYNRTEVNSPSTSYDITQDYQATIGYNYSPVVKSWEPFKNIKSKSSSTKFFKALTFNYVPNNIAFNTSMTRNYNETLLRDIESYSLDGDNSANQFLSWSQSFYWNRDLSLTWDFTKNLKFSYSSGTKAEIEEPWLQVNKDLNRTDYDVWKDSVMRSIQSLGTPYSYRQSAKVTYAVPFSTIPILDWINTSANYDTNYGWDRGASTGSANIEIGNTINNNATFTLGNRFNMVSLYNKSAFLKKVNQKFDGNSSSSRRGAAGTAADVTRKEKEKTKFELTLAMQPLAEAQIKHNLNSKKVRVVARRADDGRIVPVKFKSTDSNTIKIEPLKDQTDSLSLKFSILRLPEMEDSWWYKAAQYTARGMMSVRSVSVNYSKRNENYIYGFRPMIGDAFGQTSSEYGLKPGLGFAFGFDGGEDYVRDLLQNDFLVSDTINNISPAIFNTSTRLDIKSSIEPIKGLKIELSALREETNRTELQFMYAGMPRNLGGSFAMTMGAFSTALRSGNAGNNYASAAFDKFLAYREAIQSRVLGNYIGRDYPSGGFLTSGGHTGTFDPTKGTVSINSADVLIPAFIAAYTGKDVNSVKLSPFPSLSSMFPNWSLSYNGVLDLFPSLKKKLKSVILTHAYTCQYRVGSYSSYSDWIGMDANYGFTQSTVNGQPLPSSPYNITSVSITEAFNPLFGAEGTLNNNMTLRTRYNNSRNLSLNLSSYQIVENRKDEFVVGMTYKILNFNRTLGIKDKASKGFSNDLNISGDISYTNSQTLIRKIVEAYSQATSGSKLFSIKLSADYTLSKALTLKAYLDRVMNSPLVSSSSYPQVTTDFGISLRFTLTQ
ncbi:MAG: cell surface protein SprA [Dysgonomonas sp.]